jgi:16S rRNA (guanine527-N7)-methyltransferase
MKKLAKLLRQKSELLNLFSKGDREKIASKHIPDSLALLRFCDAFQGDGVSDKETFRVIDIGTGGGLPGLALALDAKEKNLNMSFCLVDARQKKIKAVEEMTQELDLKNVTSIAGRFETLGHEPEHRETYDLVTARAVAPLPMLLEFSAPFLKVDGKLWAWKGPQYEEDLEAARVAMELMNMEFIEAHSYELADAETRVLLEFIKVEETDSKYPRKDGKIKKRPLQ